MKKLILASAVISAAALMSSCTAYTTSYSPGYTTTMVGYDYPTYNTWGASYYPRYRYYTPRSYYGIDRMYYGVGYYNRGFAGN